MLSGIGFVPVTIGLFGIGEMIVSTEKSGIGHVERISARVGFKDCSKRSPQCASACGWFLSNSIIGFWFGAPPGHGATAASFLGYGSLASNSKEQGQIRHGRGVRDHARPVRDNHPADRPDLDHWFVLAQQQHARRL